MRRSAGRSDSCLTNPPVRKNDPLICAPRAASRIGVGALAELVAGKHQREPFRLDVAANDAPLGVANDVRRKRNLAPRVRRPIERDEHQQCNSVIGLDFLGN